MKSTPPISSSVAPATVRGKAAFTLVEVLVSSAVLGIVMFILLSTLGSSLSLWRTTEGYIAADRQGRCALSSRPRLGECCGAIEHEPLAPGHDEPVRFLTLRSTEYQTNRMLSASLLCGIPHRA